MTTGTKPAAATGLPNDKVRLGHIHSLFFDQEEYLHQTIDLINAARFALDYGKQFGDAKVMSAIDAVLTSAQEAAENNKTLWDGIAEIITKGNANA